MCLNKETQLEEVIDIIIEKLDAGGTVTFTPRGESMLPMLRDGEDVVVIKKPEGRLKLYDIPLYRRKDGSFVLHRVLDVRNDGTYVLCGDNQFFLERGITDSDVIGVVTAFYRKGKPYSVRSFRYRAYEEFWYYTRWFRGAFRLCKRGAAKALGIKPKDKKEDKKNQGVSD